MKELPYTVLTHKSYIEDAKQWCEETLGPRWSITENRNGLWCVFFCGPSRKQEYRGMYEWHFAREKDALLFGLKWS